MEGAGLTPTRVVLAYERYVDGEWQHCEDELLVGEDADDFTITVPSGTDRETVRILLHETLEIQKREKDESR